MPPNPFAVAPFRFDVTPPLQHALLGGLVPPAIALDDSLEAIGYVLTGSEKPIVVCALDWAALSNGAHLAWRVALAAAAHTTPDRVAVQCVHQHNTPFICRTAAAVAAQQADLPAMFDEAFFEACLARAVAAVRAARPRRVTHVAHGVATVREIASNRRVARDAAGRVLAMRKSACADPALRALPEGRIDPELQTIALYDGAQRVLACHFYATHPMSFYRDGRVSSDFCGLARKELQAAEPECTHVYFTGCAGNVAAGKYNDGSAASRVALTERMLAALRAAGAALEPRPLNRVAWRTEAILPPPRRGVSAEQLEACVADCRAPADERLLAAFRLGWHRRHARGEPLLLSTLFFNDIASLYLPGEMFVEYQLRARAMRAGHPVAVAAYGDDGLWYVPTREEYAAGGYEVECAFCDESVDEIMTLAIQRLLA
ncbi:MAG: hypothetical protein ABIQ12_08370 [Opitutaceae bacterium]